MINAVAARVRHVFKTHGALHVSTPSLLPKSDLSAPADHCACVLDRDGNVVLLPHDLRVWNRYVRHVLLIAVLKSTRMGSTLW